MSVTFDASQTPVGWRLTCAFTDMVHAERDDALAALHHHHENGCRRVVWEAELVTSGQHDRYEAMRAFADAHPLGWEPDYCEGYVGIDPVYREQSPSVQMSNTHAQRVMASLGFTGDDLWAGSTTAEDLHGRVLTALALEPQDAGTPDLEYGGPGTGQARTLAFGRPEGYLQHRLEQLAELVRWCEARDLPVRWS